MRARFLTAALSAAFMLWAAAATAGAWLPKPGEYYSEFRARRGVTDQYRDSTGTKGPFPGDYALEQRTLFLYNEVGWRDRWSVAFGVPVRSETVRDGKPGYGENTETGLGDLLIGVRWGVLGGGTQALSLEADWLAPMGYDRQAFPALGDGQQKVGLQALYGASLPSLNGFVELAGGARWLATDEETQSFASADVAFWAGGQFLVVGSYDGFFGDLASRHSVGPEVRLRVDERLDVIAGSRHTIAGERVIDVNEFHFGIAFKRTDLNRLQGFLGGTARP